MKKRAVIIGVIAVLLICGTGVILYYIKDFDDFFLEKAKEAYQEENLKVTELQEIQEERSPKETENISITEVKSAYVSTAKDVGVCEQIKVEAGTKSIDAKDFFYAFCGQKASIDQSFDEGMLSKVGEIYPVVLNYDGHDYPCTVEIVDTTPPEFVGYKNISIIEGDSIAYKKQVEVVDNSGKEVELSVDSSGVISTKPGQYEVIYTASDPYGNASTLTLQVTVKERFVCTEETVGPLADAVVASVVKDGMSQWDKAYALFQWCQENVHYTSASGDMSSVWAGAYEGISKRRGDCYSFAATYSVLLSRVGVQNLIVSRVGGTSPHYWNLVYTEVGWYHCDTSPRNAEFPYVCFMQTDEQIAAYTAVYTEKPNYYTFDKTAYPERGTAIVFQ